LAAGSLQVAAMCGTRPLPARPAAVSALGGTGLPWVAGAGGPGWRVCGSCPPLAPAGAPGPAGRARAAPRRRRGARAGL